MDEHEQSSTEMPQLFGDETTHDPPPEVVARGHEDLHPNTKAILLTGVGLLVLMLFGIVFSLGLMTALSDRSTVARDGEDAAGAASAASASQPFEAPETPNLALQTELQRKAMRQVLTSYGWVEREQQVARIPIERAIDVIAERGFQPWGGNQERGSDQGAGDASR